MLECENVIITNDIYYSTSEKQQKNISKVTQIINKIEETTFEFVLLLYINVINCSTKIEKNMLYLLNYILMLNTRQILKTNKNSF